MKRIVATLYLLVCLLSVATPLSAASIGYRNHELVIVDEPGKANKNYVEYYDGDTKLNLDKIEWVDGKIGKGVNLKGDDHLLLVNHLPLSVTSCTFTAWFKWNGEEVDGKLAQNQHFFTFYRGNDSMMTLYPNAVDGDGNALGHRLVLDREVRKKKLDVDFRLTDEQENPLSWEAGEWHHMALVIDGKDLRYYIDGELAYQQLWLLDFAQLRFSYLLIGDNNVGDPNLSAVIDEMSMFDVALEQETIQRLMYGIEISDTTTPIPTTTTTTTTVHPTMTTTTTIPTTTTTEFVRDVSEISSPTVWIPFAVAIVAVILIVVCWPRKPSRHAKTKSKPQ